MTVTDGQRVLYDIDCMRLNIRCVPNSTRDWYVQMSEAQ